MNELDLHDQIMIAFRKYFKYSEKWETKQFDRCGIEARNALGEIRILARKRRMEIQRIRKEIRKKRKENNE